MKQNQYGQMLKTNSGIRSALCIAAVMLAAFLLSMPVSAQKKVRGKAAAAAAAKATRLDYDSQRRFNEFFLEYVVQKQKGNYDVAFEMLRHALDIDPDAPEALSAMALMLRAVGDVDTVGKVEKLIRRAVELEPDNYYFQSQLAEYYDSQGRNDSAVARYEAMSRRFPDHDELLYNLAEIYSQQKDYTSLVRTLSRLEVKEGKSSELTLRKIEAYSSAGMNDSTLVLINSLIESDPSNATYRVIRGGAYGDMKDYDRERAEYDAVLASDPNNDMANTAIMRRSLVRNDIPAYLEKANYIALNPNIGLKTRLSALNSMIMSGSRGTVDSTAALPAFRKIFAAPEADVSFLDLYQAYLGMLKAPADSIAPVWTRLLALKPDYPAVRLKLLQYTIGKANQSETARLCVEGVQYDPDNVVYYFYGGLAHYVLKSNEKAVEMLSGGTRHIGRNTPTDLASDLYSLLGDVYHETGKDTLCFQAYDSALVYKDDNINALNNYAYYLSLKRRDLDKAAAMSLKTIKAQPSNSIYLDTYAWVLFEQGRYAEAAEFIDQAIKNLGTDRDNSSIYEHAGDIYSKQGKNDEALVMWRKAKQLGAKSKTLERKIKLRKYIAD